MIPTLEVSKAMRTLFQDEAKAVCKGYGVKNDAFNQDANAITAARLLCAELDLDWAKMDNAKRVNVMAILKVAGNASANRQAIAGTATKTESLVVDLATLIPTEEAK